MYSTFNHQIAQDRIADMHRQAQQDALARQARQDRQAGTSARPRGTCSGFPSSSPAACLPPSAPAPEGPGG